MKTFFIATSNRGKQKEIEKFASQYGEGVAVRFPDDSNVITVDETGATFEQNARLKAQVYKSAVNNDSLYYVGDDSGIVIPALNNEPGVFTRRWAGYEMTDEEIVTYCMDKMKKFKGDDRKATFETVLAVLGPNNTTEYFHSKMHGHILDRALDVEPQAGFPFRSIFWVDDIDLPIYQIHALGPDERKGFLTHREDAFRQLFTKI